ncbi:MAG: hypothetical protein JXB45_04870 [Candidatus Krumholzibacteriota bacterium]|nr:hypothetical protein [Candidatus Krumholzibacteriota bacterium]
MEIMSKTLLLTAVIMILVLLAGCAPGPNRLTNTPDQKGTVAGFWQGLWHGFIALFTFIGSLFSDKVHPYEVHNNGNWYNLGFVLGLMIFFGGGGGGVGRGSRCR